MQPTTAASSLRECLPSLRVILSSVLKQLALWRTRKKERPLVDIRPITRKALQQDGLEKDQVRLQVHPRLARLRKSVLQQSPAPGRLHSRPAQGKESLNQEKQTSQQLLGGQKKVRSKKPKETTKFKSKVEPPPQREGKDGKEAGTEKLLIVCSGRLPALSLVFKSQA